MNGSKAQAWGFDLIVAVMIFLAGMILFFFYTLNFSIEKNDVFGTLNYEGKLVGDSLLSEGFPSNWDQSNVVTIGILSEGKVNETKLKEFYDMSQSDYAKTKVLFNVVNDYYVFFDEPITVDAVPIIGIGIQQSNENNLVKLSRVVVHDNQIKNIHIYVWN
jgi:flagellar basal body-associated protein FliL